MPDIESRQRIMNRLVSDVFGRKCMDNNLRGIWAEYMVAEALGPNCRVVGEGWHAWDIQLGESHREFPDRIRIQVKNTAVLQIWNAGKAASSYCQWSLVMRPRPSYFEQNNPGVPCETFGFLCDVYVLCLHPVADWDSVDQSDPDQWEFYIVPVSAAKGVYALPASTDVKPKRASYTVVPASLRKGIRGRPPIEPLRFHELTEAKIRESLGL